MYFNTLKRRSLIFITMLLALLQGNSIPPARALGGRRRIQAEGVRVSSGEKLQGPSPGGVRVSSSEKLQGLPRLPGGIQKKRNSGQKKGNEPDHNPSLARDDQGNSYLVWEHGNELFWAINQGGNWARTGKLPGEGGNRPVVIFIPQTGKSTSSTGQGASIVQEASVDQNLSLDQDTSADRDVSGDQTAPARLFCAWESLTAPKKIIGSTGTLTGDGGINWSEPQALTGDSNDDYGIALTMDGSSNPLMLWLQGASFEDDADLYYQVITPGTGAGNQVLAPAPIATGQYQATSAASSADGRAAPSPSVDGVQDPPSNWVGQAPPPISLTGPIPPFFNSPCASVVLARLDINLPCAAIPAFGETAELEIAYFLCGTSGVTPLDPSPVLTPAVSNELVAVLTLGPHLSLGFNLFNLGQAVISTNGSPDGGCCSAVQETSYSYGGSDSFLWLSSPFPLVVCGDQIGITRVGVVGAVGIEYSFVRLPNNPETPREFVTQVTVGMGPQVNVRAFQDKFRGFVVVAGGYSFTRTVSAQGYSFTSGPGIVMSGAVRFGGDWAALLYRFTRSYAPGQWRDPNASSCRRRRPWTRPYCKPASSGDSYEPSSSGKVKPWWADPNSFYYQRITPWHHNPAVSVSGQDVPSYGGGEPAPSQETANLSDLNFLKNQDSLSPKPLMVQSGKDRVRKTITRIMPDGNALMDEVLELVKEPLVGTGAVYEGKPVLGDISSDIYNDGLAAVARSQSGEIMAVWAKALAASILGSKIFAATYTREGWDRPVEVTPEIDFHQHPALVFDSRGNPLAVWSSSSNDGLDYEQSSVEAIFQVFGKSDLLYSQRIEGKWTLPKPLAKLPGTNEQVALAAGPDGEITAVWINQSGKGSCVYGSLWNGSQWSEPRVISRTALAESPAVVYTAQKPSAVWAQDMDGKAATANDWRICTAIWDGTSWHSRQLSVGQEPPGEEEKEQTRLPGRQKDIFSPGRRLQGRAGRRRSTAAALRN